MNSKHSDEFRGMNSLRVVIFLYILKFDQSDENSSKQWIDYVNDEHSSKPWINYAKNVMRDELSIFHQFDEFSSGGWIYNKKKISVRVIKFIRTMTEVFSLEQCYSSGRWISDE